MKVLLPCAFMLFPLFYAAGEAVSGAALMDWQKMELSMDISAPLRGYKLPTERNAAEDYLERERIFFVEEALKSIPVHSSATIGALMEEGALPEEFAASLSLSMRTLPPFLSKDWQSLATKGSMDMKTLAQNMPTRPEPPFAVSTLVSQDSGEWTGIVIVAQDAAPVHGRRGVAVKALPALLPRIWDVNMNLVFDSAASSFHYLDASNIFSTRPGGLSEAVEAVVGKKPLVLFTEEVYGTYPCDLVLDAADALQIAKSPRCKKLLEDGKVVLILSDDVLKTRLGE